MPLSPPSSITSFDQYQAYLQQVSDEANTNQDVTAAELAPLEAYVGMSTDSAGVAQVNAAATQSTMSALNVNSDQLTTLRQSVSVMSYVVAMSTGYVGSSAESKDTNTNAEWSTAIDMLLSRATAGKANEAQGDTADANAAGDAANAYDTAVISGSSISVPAGSPADLAMQAVSGDSTKINYDAADQLYTVSGSGGWQLYGGDGQSINVVPSTGLSVHIPNAQGNTVDQFLQIDGSTGSISSTSSTNGNFADLQLMGTGNGGYSQKAGAPAGSPAAVAASAAGVDYSNSSQWQYNQNGNNGAGSFTMTVSGSTSTFGMDGQPLTGAAASNSWSSSSGSFQGTTFNADYGPGGNNTLGQSQKVSSPTTDPSTGVVSGKDQKGNTWFFDQTGNPIGFVQKGQSGSFAISNPNGGVTNAAVNVDSSGNVSWTTKPTNSYATWTSTGSGNYTAPANSAFKPGSQPDGTQSAATDSGFSFTAGPSVSGTSTLNIGSATGSTFNASNGPNGGGSAETIANPTWDPATGIVRGQDKNGNTWFFDQSGNPIGYVQKGQTGSFAIPNPDASNSAPVVNVNASGQVSWSASPEFNYITWTSTGGGKYQAPGTNSAFKAGSNPDGMISVGSGSNSSSSSTAFTGQTMAH